MNQLSWREYFTLTLGYFLILVVVFFTINVLHFQFLHPKIVLHGILLDTVLAIIITTLLLKFIRLLPFNSILLANACVIFFLLATLYNILGPTMCDRSLSVFLLVKIKEADDLNKPLTTSELIQVTNAQYLKGTHLVDKRLNEQQASGAIEIKNGVVTLTPSGELFANIFGIFYWALGIPKTF